MQGNVFVGYFCFAVKIVFGRYKRDIFLIKQYDNSMEIMNPGRGIDIPRRVPLQHRPVKIWKLLIFF